MSTEHQRQWIRRLKGLTGEFFPNCVPILADDGRHLGALDPLDARQGDVRENIEALTRWREKFMRYFLTQFKATPERTREWIKTRILPDDTKILFLIRCEKGIAVGNLGVCNLSEDEAELDNLIRGERGGDPRLVFFSELALMHWLFFELKVSRIRLHVFSSNTRTIGLHASVGFHTVATYRLAEIRKAGELSYVVDPDRSPAPSELGYSRMETTCHDFYQRFPWMKATENRSSSVMGL